MSTHPLLIVVGLPVAWHLALVAVAYVDAGRNGMNRRKWAVIAFLVPLFGFFAYLFEREEHLRDPDDEPDLFVDGPFKIHKSRADDAVWNVSRGDADGNEPHGDAGEREPCGDAGRYEPPNDRDG